MKNKNVPKLRFKGFSEEWKNNLLGDFLDFKNGLNADKSSYGKGVKFINVLDILSNDTITHEKIIGKVDIDNKTLEKYSVTYGDILFQRSSETREEVGTANVYIDSKPVTFGGFVIRGKKISEYNPKFMNSLLKSSSCRKEITSKAGGSTRYNVGQDVLSNISIILPSLEEQERIANFLSNVDKIIETQDLKVKDLELYKKGMMQKLFKREIRFKDINGEEYPKWEEKKLGSVIKEPSKIKVENPSEIELLTVQLHCNGIKCSGKYPNKTKNGRPYYKRFNGELLIGRQNLHNGGLGLVNSNCDSKIASNAISSYIIKNNDNLNYIYLYLSNPNFYKKIDTLLGGTGQKEISKYELENLKIQLPCLEEQEKIANCLSNIDNVIEEEKKKLEDLRLWKKGLLQQMFV